MPCAGSTSRCRLNAPVHSRPDSGGILALRRASPGPRSPPRGHADAPASRARPPDDARDAREPRSNRLRSRRSSTAETSHNTGIRQLRPEPSCSPRPLCISLSLLGVWIASFAELGSFRTRTRRPGELSARCLVQQRSLSAIQTGVSFQTPPLGSPHAERVAQTRVEARGAGTLRKVSSSGRTHQRIRDRPASASRPIAHRPRRGLQSPRSRARPRPDRILRTAR
jgi:hypothetical protein